MVRVATWNLERARNAAALAQRNVLRQVRADVAVLTEPGISWALEDDVVASPPERHGTGGAESWVLIQAIDVRPAAIEIPFERLAAAAVVTIDRTKVVVYGSVLPWRAVRAHAPELVRPGESSTDVFERVLAEQVTDIEQLVDAHPDALVLWAGDFNQSLEGPNVVGSAKGRTLLSDALDRLGFEAWNRHESHAIDGLTTIDFVCGRRHRPTQHLGRIEPSFEGRRLSDHVGYVVEWA